MFINSDPLVISSGPTRQRGPRGISAQRFILPRRFAKALRFRSERGWGSPPGIFLLPSAEGSPAESFAE
jgi:hypothetical protein